MSMFNQESKPQAPRTLAPKGMKGVRLQSIVDLGTHDDTYDGVTRDKHSVYFCFEIPGTKVSDEDQRPLVIGREFTITNGRFGPYLAKTSNLFKVIKKWMGWDEKVASKVGNFGKLLGQAAMIGVEHVNKEDKVYARINDITMAPEGMPIAELVNPITVYSLDMGTTCEAFTSLPEWQQKRILASKELNGGLQPRIREDQPPVSDNSGFEDSIPF